MNESSRTASTCPRCQRSTASPFAISGVCLRCAGARVFALAALEPTQMAPASSANAEPVTLPLGAVVLPDRIGPYEIIDELGRGGMGCIYTARQIGLGRIVALKVLATRGDLAGLDLRFLREAQTIARLHHPNIVAVYDSGRADGYVYFSMEYIAGGDLGRRLKERPFTPREAALLLERIAGATAAAHAEGVLHRDIKPSNILLDGDEPKLADFGLAAQLEPGGDLTAVSGVLGTPHYLAPEALRGGSAALTVRSDVYALGAVLFEMLTGRTPFGGVSPAELATLVETTEPPAPRLLAPAVPRDLETICLKALERDPARRYPTAAALVEDLQRFIAGRPIAARPPNAWDRLRKLARRHRTPLALIIIAVVALIAGAVASTWQAIRARRAEKLAAVEANASREVVNFLQNDLLAQASPTNQPDRDLKLRTVLDRAALKIEERFQDEPLVEAAVRETLAATYGSLGEYSTGRHHLERALALRTREQGATAAETLRAASMLAESYFNLAEYARAEALAAKTAARQQKLLGAEHPDTLATETTLAQAYEWEGRYPAAEALFRATLARQQRVLGPTSPDTLETMGGLSSALLDTGRFADAEQLLRTMLATVKPLGSENQFAQLAMNNLAGALWAEGRYAEAGELHRQTLELTRRTLGPEHPDTLRSMTNIARTYAAEGRLTEAESWHRQVLEIRRRILGDDYHDTLRSSTFLAAVLRDLGRRDEAEALFTATPEKESRILGNDHPDTLQCRTEYATLLLTSRRYAAVDTLLRPTVTSHSGGTDDWHLALARCQLGAALEGQGQFEAAEPLLVQGYTFLAQQAAKIPAVYRPAIDRAGATVAQLYADWGRPEQVAAWKQKIGGGEMK